MTDSTSSCCCGSQPPKIGAKVEGTEKWLDGFLETPLGPLPRLSTTWQQSDRLGAWKARWGFGRQNYKIPAGLYALGSPGPESEVIVTANYKFTVDIVRRTLAQKDFWFLVLDTRGINVWCAAGKGTFGTAEIIKRVKEANLEKLLNHKRLIVPQLGAPGVAAHLVQKECGFKIFYGPVRIDDLLKYLEKGKKADPDMRRVHFDLRDRVVLIPVELVMMKNNIALVFMAFWLHNIFFPPLGIDGPGLFLLASMAGLALTPIFLPWLPGKAFYLKGGFCGAILFLLLLITGAVGFTGIFSALGWLLIFTAVAAFFGMNYTGASTYTSLSGVEKEMKTALPVMAGGFATGLLFTFIGGII